MTQAIISIKQIRFSKLNVNKVRKINVYAIYCTCEIPPRHHKSNDMKRVIEFLEQPFKETLQK